MSRCRSWRVRRYLDPWRFPYPLRHLAWLLVGPVRCSWPTKHRYTSKWHCAEKSTGHIWLVTDKEREI